MRFVKNYLKENLKWLLLVLACFGILCFVIGFEQVPLAQWGYAAGTDGNGLPENASFVIYHIAAAD